MARSAILAGVAASLLTGCYNYLPRPAELEPAMYLAVTLTDSGSEALAPYLGPNVKAVRGRFLRSADQGLAISVAAVETRRGAVFDWRGEAVVVPGDLVRSVEVRQLGRAKTALFAGMSLAGFFVAYAAFGASALGGSAPGSAGGPILH